MDDGIVPLKVTFPGIISLKPLKFVPNYKNKGPPRIVAFMIGSFNKSF